MPPLNAEIIWLITVLIYNLGILALVLLAQPLVRDLTLGFRYTISNFDARQTESVLGRRLAMIKDNQVEALTLFAPLVLAAWLAAISHPHLTLTATIFLAARLAYTVVSAAGIPLLRSLAWTAGFGATLYLGWLIWTGLTA